MNRAPDIPLDFAKPPVLEVALDVQFEGLPRLRGHHLGLFWSRVRDRFPIVEEQVALAPLTVETFGVPTSQEAHIELSLLSAPPVPRLWFLNKAGSELIQIQQDRFIVNWRRVEEDEEYPHYGSVRATFEAEFRRFQSFLAAEELGDMLPNQCAVTYFNHIAAGDVWHKHGELDKIFTMWKSPNESPRLPEADDVKLTARYVIPGATGAPIGRLNVELQPAFRRSDNVPIYTMNLTARGKPNGEGLEDVLRFFDQGHLWASRAFIALTTPGMHKEWGGRT